MGFYFSQSQFLKFYKIIFQPPFKIQVGQYSIRKSQFAIQAILQRITKIIKNEGFLPNINYF